MSKKFCFYEVRWYRPAIFNNERLITPKTIVTNCGAIPSNLIEAELFGHTKTAFTGASTARKGAFEEADGGTLFLDEIGELPLDDQVKLLRVLDSRKVTRLGENNERPINVRIIAATNKDLIVEMNEKRFREDLYYRLSTVPLSLPALRNRQGDTGLLA
jgi:transcriptional regulator with GAF, ATPase, and Fis domain